MNIAVFGATGRTGRHVISYALDAGHAVTAVVRDPTRLTVGPHPLLTVVRAAVTDSAATRPALAGADAVVSTIGSRDGRAPTTVGADSATGIITAMRASSVRRLVVVSASGMHTLGDDLLTRRLAKPVLQRVLRHPFADMLRMERIVRESGLDWTLVRPPMLTDGPATDMYRTAIDRNVRGGFRLSRADLALCVLRSLAESSWNRVAVAVAR